MKTLGEYEIGEQERQGSVGIYRDYKREKAFARGLTDSMTVLSTVILCDREF